MYGIHVTVNCGMEEAEQRTLEALKAEGFGVLTEIDVKAVLKKKIDVDRKPYKILGACNPVLANKALIEEPDLGLLLPCNVVIREEEDGSTTVAIVDPESMFTVVDKPAMAEMAKEVREKFDRIMAAIEG
ncbi:DUF302 domain-containing protein [sulfur-oxidizing endosymbiont of Gigantopelta aegis]|uniref:DUF302 domain-containing protein n=1 Tax=sulfur-oxidizing endosymbiont of Gigantopelta aegis TaxID=2794934 RepID=UPI0018DC5643